MTAKSKAVALLQSVRNLRNIGIISEKEFQSLIEVLKRFCQDDKYLGVVRSRIAELAKNKPADKAHMILSILEPDERHG